MKKPTFIVVCAILFIFLDSCKQDKKEDQALKESAPQNYESIKPLRIPKNVENLVAYVSLKDSVLYVANEEKFQTVLKENLWPALKFTQGENRALFTNYMGATVPLSVKIVSASVIIMAELRVGDAHFNFERRKVNRIESYKTTCFEMNMQIGGRTWYEVLGEIARNAGGWDPNIPTPFTGTIVQIEYEIFTDPDPTGAIGAEVVQPVQRYYGYTSKDCQSGYNEFSTIQLKWVKAITGQWPNP